ncbi:hypothetical protein Tco_1383861 [Tanacetum coccineum]
MDDDKEKEELKQCFEIVPDDGDDVTIDATPLSVKIPIVDYKIYQEGKKSFFHIIRADGNTQMYLTFSKMLKNFDREDLEDRANSTGTMAGVDVNTLTMEQYLALSQEN